MHLNLRPHAVRNPNRKAVNFTLKLLTKYSRQNITIHIELGITNDRSHGYMFGMYVNKFVLKGYCTARPLFLKTLCIFLKNKATLDKLSYGSGQKCSVKLKNHSFPSVETLVVKLQ